MVKTQNKLSIVETVKLSDYIRNHWEQIQTEKKTIILFAEECTKELKFQVTARNVQGMLEALEYTWPEIKVKSTKYRNLARVFENKLTAQEKMLEAHDGFFKNASELIGKLEAMVKTLDIQNKSLEARFSTLDSQVKSIGIACKNLDPRVSNLAEGIRKNTELIHSNSAEYVKRLNYQAEIIKETQQAIATLKKDLGA